MPAHPLTDGESRSLLTPGEVAEMLDVDPKTVTRRANAGKLASFRTPGGHRRFYEDEVKAMLDPARSQPPAVQGKTGRTAR
jgi:excisionase family DNA binding protein